MRIAVIHNLTRPFLGHAGPVLTAHGAEITQHDSKHGQVLPSLGDLDGLLVLGGDQSVCEIERYPYLQREADLMREAVDEGVPVLGVCLGGQLLSYAHGGEVRRMEARVVEWAEVQPLPAATGDPLFGALPERVRALHWNEDCFTLPEGGVELLSRAGAGVEAFRIGSCAWGIQFHPEADSAALDGWYEEGAAWLAEAGIGEAEARAADRLHLGGQGAIAEALFGGFARVAAGWTNVRG